jgi:protein-S-isoprenylcysteine O-methyltransferase Ste14
MDRDIFATRLISSSVTSAGALEETVPGIALGIYVAFFAVGLGWRAWLQYRRTGDHGLRALSGRRGSVEWFVGFFLLVGATLTGASAVAGIVDLVQPIAVMDKAWLNRAGLLLACLGFVVTIVAQLQMRDSWRVGVDRRETTPLVTEGLFGMVRNPIYSGGLLAAAGFLLMVPNVLAAVAFAILLVGLQIQVRRVEEPYLTRVHRETYLAYARTVGRFIPGAGHL